MRSPCFHLVARGAGGGVLPDSPQAGTAARGPADSPRCSSAPRPVHEQQRLPAKGNGWSRVGQCGAIANGYSTRPVRSGIGTYKQTPTVEPGGAMKSVRCYEMWSLHRSTQLARHSGGTAEGTAARQVGGRGAGALPGAGQGHERGAEAGEEARTA